MTASTKIKVSELALEFLCLFIVGVSRIFFRIKDSYVYILSSKLNACSPASILRMPRHSLKFSFSRTRHVLIPLILSTTGYAKIFVTIIKRIAVDMIPTFQISLFQSQNMTMQVNGSLSDPAKSIERPIIGRIPSAPIVFGQFVKTMRANFCNLTSCERDKSIVSIGLDYWRTLEIWACHNPNNNTFQNAKEAQLA